MHKKDVESYRLFLNNRIADKSIDTLTIQQKQHLITAYENFPLNLSVTTALRETIRFTPAPEHTPDGYIHHFLIKYNKGKDWYSQRYIDLLKYLRTTIEDYDERILYIQGEAYRICFVKKYSKGDDPVSFYHVIPSHIQSQDNIIAWTHFEAKEKYIRSLRKSEEELIVRRGLTDKEGKNYVLSYDEYSCLKRKTLLYLGSNVLSGSQRSQESPSGLLQISDFD